MRNELSPGRGPKREGGKAESTPLAGMRPSRVGLDNVVGIDFDKKGNPVPIIALICVPTTGSKEGDAAQHEQILFKMRADHAKRQT